MQSITRAHANHAAAGAQVTIWRTSVGVKCEVITKSGFLCLYLNF